MDVVVERRQPFEWSDPGTPAPAIGLAVGRETRRDRGRIGLAVGGRIKAAGGPARDLYLGRGLEPGGIGEGALRTVLGCDAAGRITRMGGRVGAAMHEVGGRVAGERHQQTGIEIGVGRALHHLARLRIDRRVTERAGDAHAQMSAVVEGTDAEDEGGAARHVEARRDEFARLPDPIAHGDVAGHADLQVGGTGAAEHEDGARHLKGRQPPVQHAHHVGEKHLVAERLAIERLATPPHQRVVDRHGAALRRQGVASLRCGFQPLRLVPCDAATEDVEGGLDRGAVGIEKVACLRHRRVTEAGQGAGDENGADGGRGNHDYPKWPTHYDARSPSRRGRETAQFQP